MYLAFKRGQITQAQRLAVDFMKLTLALFSEGNPVPVKYALSLLKIMSRQVRLPLVEPSSSAKAEIASALEYACERHSDYIIGNVSGLESRRHQSIRVATN
jgi:4-hydroxy-tetrahydrodipicolinate synthase